MSKNCYAERMAARFSGSGQPYEGLTHKGKWTGEVRVIEDKMELPLKWRKPRMVFVNSMSDLFHENVSDYDIARIFWAMALAPNQTFQVLTKRTKRMHQWFAKQAYRVGDGVPKWPLPNVWLGVSVENQATADERIPLLLECPAAVRWISAEPLLEGLELHQWLARYRCTECGAGSSFTHPADSQAFEFCDDTVIKDPSIDWLVLGGESGPGARSCDVSWIRSLLKQCQEAGAPTYVKQLGSAATKPKHCPTCNDVGEIHRPTSIRPCPKCDGVQQYERLKHRKGGNPDEWPEDLRVREWPHVATLQLSEVHKEQSHG